MAFWPDEVDHMNRNHSDFATVLLKGDKGLKYFGGVGSFDLDSEDDGNRYVQLWNAERWSDNHWTPIRINESLSSVLIRASEIAAIEFTYYGTPHHLEPRVSDPEAAGAAEVTDGAKPPETGGTPS